MYRIGFETGSAVFRREPDIGQVSCLTGTVSEFLRVRSHLVQHQEIEIRHRSFRVNDMPSGFQTADLLDQIRIIPVMSERMVRSEKPSSG